MKMKSTTLLLITAAGCISPTIELNTTQEDTDVVLPDEFYLNTESSELYGMSIMRGWHVLLNGDHGLVREFSDGQNEDEEFIQLFDWDQPWGFTVSIGSYNESVHEYLVSGVDLPLFQMDGKLLTLVFEEVENTNGSCAISGTKAKLKYYNVQNGVFCDEYEISVRGNAKVFCKSLVEEEFYCDPKKADDD